MGVGRNTVGCRIRRGWAKIVRYLSGLGEKTGAEVGKAGARFAKRAQAIEEPGGVRIIEEDLLAGLEIEFGLGEGVGGDEVELGRGREGAGRLVGVEVFEEEFGEEVGKMEPVELGTEGVEPRGGGAKMGDTLAFPVAGEGEAVVDEVAGFVGEGVGRFVAAAGTIENAADGFAAGAAGFEGDVGEGGMLAFAGGGDGNRFTGGVGGAVVFVDREKRVGLVHPRGGEVEPEGRVRIERKRAQNGDGFLLAADGFDEGGGIVLEVKDVAAVHPCGAEAVAGVDEGVERKGAEEGDGFVVGVDGAIEGFGGILPLEGVAAVHGGERELVADLELSDGKGAEERDRLFVVADGVGERFGRKAGFEGLAVAHELGDLGERFGERHGRV